MRVCICHIITDGAVRVVTFGMLIASLVPSLLHARARKGLVKKGRTSLSSRYVYCGPIRLQNHGHMTLVECNYVWYVRMHVRSVYAHGTEVAVNFYFTHTGIANYCIPARRVSATLLTSPFLTRAWRGLGTRLAIIAYCHYLTNPPNFPGLSRILAGRQSRAPDFSTKNPEKSISSRPGLWPR